MDGGRLRSALLVRHLSLGLHGSDETLTRGWPLIQVDITGQTSQGVVSLGVTPAYSVPIIKYTRKGVS